MQKPSELRALAISAAREVTDDDEWRDAMEPALRGLPPSFSAFVYALGPCAVLALLDVADELNHQRAMIVSLMGEKDGISAHTMRIFGAKLLEDIDAAIAKLETIPNVTGDGK